MPYLRPARRRRGPVPGPGGALGDAQTAPPSPVAVLAEQVNRFGPSAPAAFQFIQAPFLATGKLAPDLALTALLIYHRRASDAYAQFHDAGSAALIDAANAGFSNPVSFVTGRMDEVTKTVAQFADSVGLPPAQGSAVAGDIPLPLLLAAGALVLWLALR
jgi:hypothetical protein